MVIASLNCEKTAVFSVFENREKILAQPKGLFLRINREKPRKIVKVATFLKIKNGISAGLKGRV